jgi:hypothetical protein
VDEREKEYKVNLVINFHCVKEFVIRKKSRRCRRDYYSHKSGAAVMVRRLDDL